MQWTMWATYRPIVSARFRPDESSQREARWRARIEAGARHDGSVMLILFVLGGAVAIAGVPVWAWRLQRRVVASLMPGADLEDVAAIADLPLGAEIAPGRHLVTEPLVHLLFSP